jgi:hypothetical protein
MNSINNHYLVVILVISIWLFTACSKKVYFQPNNVGSDLRGFVKLKSDRNKNYKLKLKLFYIEDIEKILENKKTYTIWMQNSDSTTTKIAQFHKDNTNHTEINKIFAEKPTKIFVSEQMQSNIMTPAVTILTLTY